MCYTVHASKSCIVTISDGDMLQTSSYSTSLEIATQQWDTMMMTMASGINLWELEP